MKLKHKSRWMLFLLGGVIAWLIYEKYGTSYAGAPLTGPTGFPSLRTFKRELHPVHTGTKNGYMDRSGRLVIDPVYDAFDEFYDDLATVTKDNTWGCLRSTGQFHSCPEYHNLSRFSNGWARASKVQGFITTVLGHFERFTFIDAQGNRISTAWYDDAGDFSEGLARVNRGAGGFRQRVGGRWGFIDTKGREVIPLQFSDVGDFYEDLARVEKDGKWGFITPSGEFQITPRYEYVRDFSEGLAAVILDGKYHYIDSTGEVKIAGPFEIAGEFSEGKAAVGDKSMGMKRYINRDGDAAFSGEYEFASAFSDGIARVSTHPNARAYGFIDHQGKFVIQQQYKYVTDFIRGYAYTDEMRLIDTQGKPLELKP